MEYMYTHELIEDGCITIRWSIIWHIILCSHCNHLLSRPTIMYHHIPLSQILLSMTECTFITISAILINELIT